MKTRFFIFAVIFAMFAACDKDDAVEPYIDDPTDKVEYNRALAESYIGYWDAHDMDKLMELFAEDCEYWEMCHLRPFNGKEELRNYFVATLSGLPDTRFTVNSSIADEKMAVVEWTWTATNTVGWPQMGIPATGEHMELRGLAVMEIEDDHIVVMREYWDWNTFLVEIGVG